MERLKAGTRGMSPHRTAEPRAELRSRAERNGQAAARYIMHTHVTRPRQERPPRLAQPPHSVTPGHARPRPALRAPRPRDDAGATASRRQAVQSGAA